MPSATVLIFLLLLVRRTDLQVKYTILNIFMNLAFVRQALLGQPLHNSLYVLSICWLESSTAAATSAT